MHVLFCMTLWLHVCQISSIKCTSHWHGDAFLFVLVFIGLEEQSGNWFVWVSTRNVFLKLYKQSPHKWNVIFVAIFRREILEHKQQSESEVSMFVCVFVLGRKSAGAVVVCETREERSLDYCICCVVWIENLLRSFFSSCGYCCGLVPVLFFFLCQFINQFVCVKNRKILPVNNILTFPHLITPPSLCLPAGKSCLRADTTYGG